jgi:hypothetical protein
MKIHKSITVDMVVDAAERQMFGTDNPGFCIKCGAEHDCCEPDASEYECYECGENAVYGAELLLMYVM